MTSTGIYAIAPKQDRSRLTEARLLKATIAILCRSGLAGCSVPEIAKEAGLAVGTVYRRYPDKDRLLADAILSLYDTFDDEGEKAVLSLVSVGGSMIEVFERLSLNMIAVAKVNRTLVLATRDFVAGYPDEPFQREYAARRGRPRLVLLAALGARFGSQIVGGELPLRIALASLHGVIQLTYIENAPGLFDECPEPEEFAKRLAVMQYRYLVGS